MIEGLIPEIITFIPVVKNKFGLDSTGVKKNNTKMFAPRIYGHYLKLKKVHDIMFSMTVILCLCGTLLASWCCKIERKSRYIARQNPLLCLACLQNTHKNSIVSPREITNDPASLVFETVETIMWKLPVASQLPRLSQNFFKWLRRSGRSYGNQAWAYLAWVACS